MSALLALPGWLSALFGLSFTLTVALYFMRPTRRRVEVAFLRLWKPREGVVSLGSLGSRIVELRSLALQLLILALVLAGAMSLMSRQDPGLGRNTVVLMDVSASMEELSGGTSSLGQGKELVRKRVEALRSGDKMILVALGAEARPVSSFTSDREELLAALDRLVTTSSESDFSVGQAFADELLRGRSRPETVFVSDRAISKATDSGSPRAASESLLRVGPKEPVSRPRIQHLGARRTSSSTVSAVARLENPGSEIVAVRVTLKSVQARGVETLLDARELELQPHSEAEASFESVNGAGGGLGLMAELTLLGRPPLERPHEQLAYAALSHPRSAKVLLIGRSSSFFEASLLVSPGISAEVESVLAYEKSGAAELSVFYGTAAPRRVDAGPALYFVGPEAPAAHLPVELGARKKDFGFDTWVKDHPVFRGIDPYDIQVAEGYALVPAPTDRVLARSEGQPILIEGEREGGRFLALGFVPERSDFVLRAEFPIWVENVVSYLLREDPSATKSSYRAGESLALPLPGKDGTSYRLESLTDPKYPVRRLTVSGGIAPWSAERAGLYRAISESSQGKEKHHEFAVTAALQVRSPPADGSTAPRSGPELDPESRGSNVSLLWALLLLTALVSCFEWLGFHRRWTV